MEKLAYLPLKKEKNFNVWAGVLLIVLTVVITGQITEFNLTEAFLAIPGIVNFILTDFFPPAVKALPQITSPLLDTFYMAVVATVTSALISIGLAFLGATPTTPHLFFKVFIRALASILRNIPALGWTIILVPAFGIGKLVGVIALTIGSLGSMIRFYIETIEEIDTGKIEAVRATGGSYWQILRSAVLPQSLPSLISWTLYSFELDIRASTIIGMVGGGGIGFYIQSTIKLFRYDAAAMAIMEVALLVVIIEFISKKIREWLL